MEKLNITKYKAFDGKIFDDLDACEAYERNMVFSKVALLRSFPVVFPMQDQVTDCTAYLITSEEYFNGLLEYIDWNFSEVYVEDIKYNGIGWYVLQSDNCGWASVTKLSEIIHDWSLIMDKIAKYTIDFEMYNKDV